MYIHLGYYIVCLGFVLWYILFKIENINSAFFILFLIFFVDLAMWLSMDYTGSLKSLMFLTTYGLQKSDFHHLIEDFPETIILDKQ